MRLIAVAAMLGLLGVGVVWLMSPGAEPSPKAMPATATAAVASPPPHDSREELMRAANRLENSPCDKRLRAPLHDAILAFLEDVRRDRKEPDSDAGDIILEAMEADVMGAGEVFHVDVRSGSPSMRYGSAHRFTCDVGGADEHDGRR